MPAERQPIRRVTENRAVRVAAVVVLAGSLAACESNNKSSDVKTPPPPSEMQKILAPNALDFSVSDFTVKDICKPDGSNKIPGAKPDASSVVILQADNENFADMVGDSASTVIIYTRGTAAKDSVGALVPPDPLFNTLVKVDGTHGVAGAKQGLKDSCWTMAHIKVISGKVQEQVDLIPTTVTQGNPPKGVIVY